MGTGRLTGSFAPCRKQASRQARLTTRYGVSMAALSVPPGALGEAEKKGEPEEPEDHALGRSGGGLTTKIHILCDSHGHPLHVHLSPGQTDDSSVLDAVLIGVHSRLLSGHDESFQWPCALAGDKGYRAQWIDEYLLDLGISPVIPSKANEHADARLVHFDKQAYRDRNIVKRLIGWLKESRRVFSRFEKTAINYLGMVKMAFIGRYLRLQQGGL